jgi:hypothetical protein
MWVYPVKVRSPAARAAWVQANIGHFFAARKGERKWEHAGAKKISVHPEQWLGAERTVVNDD